MKKNQKGFGAVEVLLILVIVSLIGFIGWYVWTSTSKTNETLNNADKSSSVNSNTSAIAVIPSGWTSYQNKNLGISFTYPKNWTFEDKSKEPTSTKSYYVGELTSDDKATTVAITLVRKKDGRNVYSSIAGWKTHADNSNIEYSNLTELKSHYLGFSYVLDVGGATSLIYQVLDLSNNVEVIVLPTETNQKVTVEQIINTLRFE